MDGHTDSMPPRPLSEKRKKSHALGTGLVIFGLVLLYVFVGSAGNLLSPQWPIYQTYYDMLADGFRSGHLSIAYTPNPELLTVEDPWDMKHYRKWLVDGTYYDGKYYLYWGPVPAIVQAAVKELFGINKVVGDQYIVFGALCLLATSAAFLIERMASRLFPEVPRFLVLVGMITFGCSNPFLHLAATGGVYQGAILSAQAFMVAGLFLALEAVWRGQIGERTQGYLFGAGLAWALALGCRVSLAPALGLLMLGSWIASNWTKASTSSFQLKHMVSRRHILDALLLGVPVLVSAVALLTYNWLRFDDFLEFGTGLMTTSMKFRFSFDYWPANIYAYLLQTFQVTGQFPYLHQMTRFGEAGIPSWMEYPKGLIMDEPVVGMLKAVPLTWLGPLAVFFGIQTFRKHRLPEFTVQARLSIVYVMAFLIIGTVTGFAALGVFITTMRYMGDFTAGFVLLGVMGGFSLYSAAAKWKAPGKLSRVAVGISFCALSLGTIGFGLAFGYQGYGQQFERFNPKLHQQLIQHLSIPSGPAGPS